MDEYKLNMKKIFYSYLLNREKDLKNALVSKAGITAELRKTLLAARLARKHDCYDGENRPGKLVKITLEVVGEDYV